MTGPKSHRAPLAQPPNGKGPHWRTELDPPSLSLRERPASSEALRHDFANRVVRWLAEPGTRVAVIDEHGRPAVVNVREPLYELLAQDHPIVGIYQAGARIKDVIEDLKAAGL